jgi:PEP-CTERM/exosortase A-associated glycosyltransferase
MKILHVLDHSVPLQSGYASRSRAIVDFQRRLGLEPLVLTSPKHSTPTDRVDNVDGIAHYRTAAPRPRHAPAGANELLLMARLASRLRAIARTEQPAVIHAHSPSLNGLPALWVGKRLGIPVVYEARAFWEDAAVDHGTTREGSARYRLSRAVETWLFRRADHAITICEGMRQELIRRGIPGHRISVVPNGVDPVSFQPVERNDALARRLGLDGGPVFGFVGSFYRYEGLRFLVEAMAELRRRLPGAQLLLVGGGEEAVALQARADTLGSAVILPGRVPPDAVRDYYSTIDVFVCPRRRMRLTELVTPLKPLEAMAMAQPVLASDVGGLAELIEHRVTGLLFTAEDRESFLAEAESVGRDRQLRQRLGTSARAHVLQERTWDRIIPRHLEVYGALAR